MIQRIVAVRFKHAYDREYWGNKEFHYLTLSRDLQEGDLVVVETKHGYSVAQVIRYLANSSHAFRYIIQKVDLSEHEQLLAKARKATFIQAEIEERAEAIRKRKELEILAKEDEKLKALMIDMDELLS